ncbi:hypothetical protein [Coxiella-like endosymbiont]|uniref:hypothetical protein n=1 Tax=Coxiella-like endosymbiont TaxID=1592897 RepID=UPI002729B7BA|nr:hypothetical protein [Coxiella-like endosymbiont]
MTFFQALEVIKTTFDYSGLIENSHRKYSVCLREKIPSEKQTGIVRALERSGITNAKGIAKCDCVTKKDVFYFLFKEVSTFNILYYISEQLPTLAEDVFWLQPVPREIFLGSKYDFTAFFYCGTS